MLSVASQPALKTEEIDILKHFRIFSARLELLIVAALFGSACTSTQSSEHPSGHVHWGYATSTGPSLWCDLDAANSPCCEGHEQSPIDIKSSTASLGSLPSLGFTYPVGTYDVTNNGHTVQATFVADHERSGMTIGATFYPLQQFHLHTPSEHAIDGHHAPVELHFVHRSDAGNLAVIGVMVEPGAANAELEKIWKLAPADEGKGGTAHGVDVASVMPASHANFRYAGSLTTPPCSERVQWIVMQTPITMSDAQIQKLEAMFSGHKFPNGNARPVQPLGARTIEVDPGN
jgi:carbonic anhydrase